MIADVIRPGKGALRELGVTKVYDFRSDTEIKKYDTPLPQIEGVDVVHIPVFQTADYSPEMMAKCVRAGHSLRFHPLAYTLLSGDINYMLAARQRYGSWCKCPPSISYGSTGLHRALFTNNGSWGALIWCHTSACPRSTIGRLSLSLHCWEGQNRHHGRHPLESMRKPLPFVR